MKKKGKNVSIVRKLDQFSSTSLALQELGYQYNTRILESRVVEANRIISRALQIPLASQVYKIRRLRIVEGEPKAIETSYIPYEYVKGIEALDLNDCSFYTVLKEQYKIEISQSEEEILIVQPAEDESELLRLAPDEEVVVLKGLTYDRGGRKIESYENVAVCDFYIFRSVKRR